MAGKKPGYSLAEVIIVVLIIGAIAFITVPRLNFAAIYRKQAHTVAKKISTDLRRTRNLAIVNAATNSTGFTLRMTGSSPYTTPIAQWSKRNRWTHISVAQAALNFVSGL
jgi:prepilin-type N-terminal cleavage/methylation domain-containing protein